MRGQSIDGTYIRGPANDFSEGDPFYYCPDVVGSDSGYNPSEDVYTYYPIIFFGMYVNQNGWIFFFNDVNIYSYTNDNTKIPRTGWQSISTITIGSYIGL